MAWKHPKSLTGTAELEEGSDIALDFERFFSASEQGVLPVVAQDVESRDVLVLAHANKVALDCTLREGVAAFWSLSRDIKGETSCWTSSRCAWRAEFAPIPSPSARRLSHAGPPSCYYRRLRIGLARGDIALDFERARVLDLRQR